MGNIDNLISQLSFELESESEETRRHALLSLLNLPVNEAIIILVKSVLDKDTSDQNKYIARKFLNSVKLLKDSDTRSAQPDCDTNLNDRWPQWNREEKIQSVHLLIEGEKRDCLGTIVSRLEGEGDNWVVASLIKAVGYLGTSSHVPVIQPYLEHSDTRVQANAVEALEAIGDSTVVALLLPMLKKKDHRIRANAVKAIYKYDKEAAFAVVREQSVSENVWDRDSALHCISVLKDDSLYPLVLEMYQSELDGQLRKKEKQFLDRVGIEIPNTKVDEGALLSEEDSALLGDGVTTRIKEMNSNEAHKRVKNLRSTGDEGPSSIERLLNYTPLIGLAVGIMVMLMTGYALFFGGHSSLSSIARSVKIDQSPFSVKGCPYKGEIIKFNGVVLKHDGKAEELLIEFDNRRILCSSDESLSSEFKVGVRVRGSCKITGKTRFGSIYGKIINISK